MSSIKHFFILVLLTFSVSVMAQTQLVLGSAPWGQSSWGSLAGTSPTAVPAMPIEGLAALIVLMALLPLWRSFRRLLQRPR